MAEIVNLNKARKRRRRAEDVARAEANRVKHGRPKAAKVRDRDALRRAEAALDGKKLDDTQD